MHHSNVQPVYLNIRIIHGQVVKVVEFKTLASHHCRLDSIWWYRILSCEEGFQKVGVSSRLPVRDEYIIRTGTRVFLPQ